MHSVIPFHRICTDPISEVVLLGLDFSFFSMVGLVRMRIYELALVLKSSSSGKRKKIVDEIKNYLKGLKITKEEEIGEKPLSYKIKKEDPGYYMKFLFEGDSIPVDFEKKLINNEEVLRHLLIRKK